MLLFSLVSRGTSGLYTGFLVFALHCNTAESYQPSVRAGHSTILIDDQLYVWGGSQPGLPRVHSSAEKQQFTSFVDVFHRRLGVWVQYVCQLFEGQWCCHIMFFTKVCVFASCIALVVVTIVASTFPIALLALAVRWADRFTAYISYEKFAGNYKLQNFNEAICYYKNLSLFR